MENKYKVEIFGNKLNKYTTQLKTTLKPPKNKMNSITGAMHENTKRKEKL